MGQHRAQVLEVEKQQLLIIGDLKNDVQDAPLHLIEVEKPPHEERTHFRDSSSDRMPLLSENIPETDGKIFERELWHPYFLPALVYAVAVLPGLTDARDITFDVGQKDRNTHAAETLRKDTQGNGFSRAGCPGDKSVTVRHPGEKNVFGCSFGKGGRGGHRARSCVPDKDAGQRNFRSCIRRFLDSDD